MAKYLTIKELVNAEQWKGDNYKTIFEFLNWEVWDKRDNSASGANFSIDNSGDIEEEGGGDGILYVGEGIPVPVGHYIVINSSNSISVMDSSEFNSKYKLA